MSWLLFAAISRIDRMFLLELPRSIAFLIQSQDLGFLGYQDGAPSRIHFGK
jgi:hypothetical protein